jgi:tetratricopeptide (TPR) repeat protein
MEQPNSSMTVFARIAFFVFLLGTLVFPLVFLPNLASSFELPKWGVLVGMALAGLILWAADGLQTRKLKLALTPLARPLVALALIYVLATLVGSPNKLATLWGRTGLVLAGTLVYVVATTLLANKAKHLLWSLIGASFLVSWVAIFAYLELLPKLLPNVGFATNQLFTPTGGPLALLGFLAVMLPTTVVLGLKKQDSLLKVLLFSVGAVQAIALILTVSLVLPGQTATPLAFLPYSAGWSIAVDQFKTFRSALLGVGPENFLSAFTRFRPVELNAGDLWSVRFTASSNEIFSVLTTVGVLGLLALVWVYGATVQVLRAKTAQPLNLALGTGFALTLLAFLVIPASTVLLFTFFVLAAALTGSRQQTVVSLRGQPALVVGVIVLGLALASGYFAERVFGAERAFSQSLVAAAQNQGTETYNLQIEAIRSNPFEARYRLAYSNTNLAIANGLASKENLTDEDRQTITQLVSQAIREGKNGTALAPQNAGAWENLANIYRQLINFAQGADQWALTSFVQAVRLDPTNPRLRVDLGGFLFSLQNYDAAIDQFKRAVELKPDFANAYYNLAYAYKQKKDYPQAFVAMQQVVKLVGQDSTDFDKATGELEQLRALLPEDLQTATQAAQKKPGELTPPQPLPSPKPGTSRLPLSPQDREDLAPQPSPVPQPSEGEEAAQPLPSPSPNPSPSPAPTPPAGGSPQP